jgi:cell division septation protein DedD
MGTTTTDDTFHEIQLNGKQLVFLFMSVVVAAVVVFLLGVLVGRDVLAQRGPLEALAPSDAAPVADAAVPAVAPSSAPTAAANEELSYPSRLANSEPAPEKLRPASEPPPVRATAPPADAAPAPPPVQTASASAVGLSEPAGDGFAIQVAALRQRAEADGVARSLATKGYPAYVLDPESGAPPVFRVRVGKFKERSEAESVAARLQQEEQFKPWIVR